MRDDKGRFIRGHTPLSIRDKTTGRFTKVETKCITGDTFNGKDVSIAIEPFKTQYHVRQPPSINPVPILDKVIPTVTDKYTIASKEVNKLLGILEVYNE